ncbi:DUF4037 domain-containing protein [Spirosoma gilvum]
MAILTIPQAKRNTLDLLVNELQTIDNLVAIVLGGSHCMGLANESSDLDVGLYYYPAAPFAIDEVKSIANKYHVEDTLTVTDFYQWGAWVNGGAWINTASGEVDFIYRNIEQLKATIDKARNGIWETDFDQQPPYGFSSVIYLAETKYCYPLYDPYGIIKELKQQVEQYPPKLKQTIVQQGLWAAAFALWQAEKFAAKQDLYTCMGCFTRIVKNIVDVLFALNEEYAMGDKRSLDLIVKMPRCPNKLIDQIEEILSSNRNTLSLNASRLRELFDQVVRLADGMYQPYFNL